MAQRLAIVGGDAAGMSAASAARRRDAHLEIVAFERGPYTSYSACGIPYFVAGLFAEADRLVSRSPDEHRANGIDVRTRCEVVAIDLVARTLTARAQTGEEGEEPFDQVVIATGAQAAVPPIPGAAAVEPARTVDAGERLRHALERGGRDAVVIGAGYIGLELAEALVDRGLRVTMVDRASQVMATLDADMAAHVQDAAEGYGVQVLLGAAVEEIVTGRDDAPIA
ncbi:MAG: FAD-dependent oxidoreductase, partial [Actinomycetota bacterium]|nr:FAD-dependent oxidoreductase [Actinomycetota bacterium]